MQCIVSADPASSGPEIQTLRGRDCSPPKAAALSRLLENTLVSFDKFQQLIQCQCSTYHCRRIQRELDQCVETKNSSTRSGELPERITLRFCFRRDVNL
jgi:hypothetical protein